MLIPTRDKQLVLFVKSKGNCPISYKHNLLWDCADCIFDSDCPGGTNKRYTLALDESIQKGLLTEAEIFDEKL